MTPANEIRVIPKLHCQIFRRPIAHIRHGRSVIKTSIPKRFRAPTTRNSGMFFYIISANDTLFTSLCKISPLIGSKLRLIFVESSKERHFIHYLTRHLKSAGILEECILFHSAFNTRRTINQGVERQEIIISFDLRKMLVKQFSA